MPVVILHDIASQRSQGHSPETDTHCGYSYGSAPFSYEPLPHGRIDHEKPHAGSTGAAEDTIGKIEMKGRSGKTRQNVAHCGNDGPCCDDPPWRHFIEHSTQKNGAEGIDYHVD